MKFARVPLMPNLLYISPGCVRLLSSARPAETALEYSSDAAIAVVRALRTMGKPAVFDLGSGVTPTTFQLQREMDQLVLVVDPVSVTLHMAREMLQEIDASRPDAESYSCVVDQPRGIECAALVE